MGLGCKALLAAAALVCAAAPAWGYGSADATFVAVDYAWRANDTDANTLTIAPGQSVTFSYPAGMTTHNVHFTDRPLDCPTLPPGPRPKGWSATCTFPQAGSYPFICDLHGEMRGTVVVAEPTLSPIPTASAPPGDPSTPAATPTPEAGGSAPAATTPAQAAVKLKLASRQKGARVRGTVEIAQAASRLEVTVKLGKAKAGSWLKKSAAKGTVSFSVSLNAATRKALRAKHRLRLSVAVALTPPSGKKLTKTAKATVSL